MTPVGLQSIHSLTVELAAIISATKPDAMENQFMHAPSPQHQQQPQQQQQQQHYSSQDGNSANQDHNGSNRTHLNSSPGALQSCQDGQLSQDMKNLKVTEQIPLTSNVNHLTVHSNQEQDEHRNQHEVSSSSHNSNSGSNVKSESCAGSSYSLLEAFIRLWKNDTQGKVPVNAFVCSKNVVLMDKADNAQVTYCLYLKYLFVLWCRQNIYGTRYFTICLVVMLHLHPLR